MGIEGSVLLLGLPSLTPKTFPAYITITSITVTLRHSFLEEPRTTFHRTGAGQH